MLNSIEINMSISTFQTARRNAKKAMGRYFGIGNNTRNHIVGQGTSCWKEDDFCECHAVMHLFGWDVADDIYSCCYDTCCEFKYDGESQTMECVTTSNSSSDTD